MAYRNADRTARASASPETSRARTQTPPSSHWANILASLDEAVVVANTAERVTFLNPAAETLTGVSARKTRGRPLARLFPGDRWLVDMIRETLTTGHGRRRGEGVLTRAGHSPVAVTVTISPLLDAAGIAEGTVIVLHDISYRRTLEEASRHAERASSLEFLSMGLAHEIKNPLGAIKGAAQLLEHTAPAASVGEHTAVIVREVDRLARLLDELRDLTQPPPLEFAPVNLHKVLHTVVDLARQRPEWGATTLVAQFDPSLPDVRANEEKLVQVFLNLVINAVQAMDGTGVLTIVTRMITDYHVRKAFGTRGRFLSVEIADTGPGIDPANAANLFAPFFTTKPGGSGLGLAICQQIIVQHHGRISLHTGRRSGAVARVMLPVALSAQT
jgi:two-component system nitrogen regulation sensor histidine kinase GlnL